MDILQLVSSVSKLSIIAFCITFAFLAYEIYLIKRDRKKDEKISIPQFSDQKTTSVKTAKLFVKKKETATSKGNLILIIVLILVMILFAGLIIYSYIQEGNSKKAQARETKVVTTTLNSRGIRIFDDKWSEIKLTKIPKEVVSLYVGLETIQQVDIDKARIRVNEKYWKQEHTTTELSKQHSVWYRKINIDPGMTDLQIEAQLHSKTEGWLGQ